MIRFRYKLLNWMCLAGLLYFLCGIQTSFWYQFTSGAPAPQLWLIVFVYLTLYRNYTSAMIGSYLLAATVVHSFSAVPMGMLWMVLFVLVTFSSFVKGRIFWSSSRNFVIGTAAMSILYHVLFLVLSRVFETSVSPWQLGTRIAEILFTSLCALPMFWVLQSLDRWTLSEVVLHE